MATTEDCLRPTQASTRDEFALMLHDRLLELEAKMSALEPAATDPDLRVVTSSGVASTVFVRVRSTAAVDPAAVARAALTALGHRDGDARWELWSCQHWSCLLSGQTHVLECVVQRSNVGCPGDADAVVVGHAVLDAVKRECPDASAETYVPRCSHWFEESVREAGGDHVHAWDPRVKDVVSYVDSDSDDDDHPTRRVWIKLHGWLASQLEATDVWHPKALMTESAGVDLVSALSTVL